ncbi:MAG: hypothetical protein P1U36_00250 [Legionellaceae bacterium]|nr:hypothetical protein [Legionellaceae bacterium]
MGGVVQSKYIGLEAEGVPGDAVQSEKNSAPAEAFQERTATLPEGTLFKPRRLSIADLEYSFSERWSLSGEDHFNIASLELLNSLLQQETTSESDKLDVLDQWIKDKSSSFNIIINKKQVNAVSRSIKQQRTLPEDCLILLDRYLAGLPSDFDVIERINAVSDEHAHDLSVSAEEHQLVHHDLPHALEIEWRTMNMLKKLKMWQSQTPRDAFFRATIACMVRLHDHEQKNQRLDTSNEEITAERVITWLNTALNLSDDRARISPEETAVKQIIQFMAHRIIVCGTTMIYSQKRTMDLIELLFVLEKAADDVQFSLALESNQRLIEGINITTILVGSNDKNPGASLWNALMQLRKPSMATLSLIKHYYQEVSVLDSFFSSTQFKAYYDLDRLRAYYHTEGFADDYDERGFFEAVNKQAFLIMVVPHICMRPEFLETTAPYRVKLRAFIQLCRSKLALDPEVFKTEFEDGFIAYDVENIVNTLFFEQISSEVAFSHSQEGGLTEMAETNLPGMGIERADVIYSLIDPSVPLQDARHLKALKIFFDGLASEDKIILCKELMMTVVCQAGAMKALELGLADLNTEASFCQAML